MKAALFWVVVVGAALLASQPGPDASAHAALARSVPASNDFLRRSPPRIQLDFTEPVQLSSTTVRLLDGSARPLALGPASSSNGDTTLTADVPGLEPGFYNVVWGNTSKVDGHAYQGSFPFTILNPDGSLPAGENAFGGVGTGTDPSPLAEGVAVRFLSLLGLVMVGGVSLILLLWQGTPPATERVLMRTLLGGAFVLGAATMLNLQLLADAFSGTSLASLLLDTRSGMYWISRMSAVVFILAVVGLRLGVGRGAGALALWATVIYLVAYSATSHAAAGAGSRWAGAIDFGHGLAAIGWIGAVLGLALASRSAGREAAYASVMPRFSLLASVCVFVLVGTGLFNGFVEVSSPSELVDTRYGVTILAKLVVMVPLLALGLHNATLGRRRFLAQPVREHRRFVVSVAAEAALGLAVFLPAAMLTQTGVAKSVPDLREAPVHDQTVQAAALGIRLQVDPNRTGLNTFRVTVTPGGGEVGADSVKLVFRYQEDQTVGPATLSLAPAESPGQFIGQGAFLNQEGRWRIEVEVRRTGADDVKAFYDVRPAGPPVATINRGGPWSNPAQGMTANEFGGMFLWRGQVSRRWRYGGWANQTLAVAGFAMGFFLIFGTHRDAPRPGLRENPIFPDQNSISAGRQLYTQNCIGCHGVTGAPPKGLDLAPYPLDLTVHVPQHPDGQLFAFVNDGVAATAMRAWGSGKDRLSEEQIWHIVNYLRTLGAADE